LWKPQKTLRQGWPTRLYNGYPGPNSNTFVFTVVTEAGGSVDLPNTAYGWDYLP